MKSNILQIVLACVFLGLLVLLTDPFMLWMPEAGLMAVLLCITLLAAVWMGLIAYERAGDERDILHRMHADRAAYLSGIVVLTAALVSQGLAHAIDPWVTGALGLMIAVKLVARLYTDHYR